MTVFQTDYALKLALKPGDTFVDFGSGDGLLSVVASKLVGQLGKVVAIAETKDFQETCKAAYGIPQIRVAQRAHDQPIVNMLLPAEVLRVRVIRINVADDEATLSAIYAQRDRFKNLHAMIVEPLGGEDGRKVDQEGNQTPRRSYGSGKARRQVSGRVG